MKEMFIRIFGVKELQIEDNNVECYLKKKINTGRFIGFLQENSNDVW